MTRGASKRVMDAINGEKRERGPSETNPPCPKCRSPLRIYVEAAGIGRTVEQCTNIRCTLSQPHTPIPAPDNKPMRPERERKPRKLAPAKGQRAKDAMLEFD